MFGRYVEVDGERVFVCCCPDTPMIVLIQKARAVIAERSKPAICETCSAAGDTMAIGQDCAR